MEKKEAKPKQQEDLLAKYSLPEELRPYAQFLTEIATYNKRIGEDELTPFMRAGGRIKAFWDWIRVLWEEERPITVKIGPTKYEIVGEQIQASVQVIVKEGERVILDVTGDAEKERRGKRWDKGLNRYETSEDTTALMKVATAAYARALAWAGFGLVGVASAEEMEMVQENEVAAKKALTNSKVEEKAKKPGELARRALFAYLERKGIKTEELRLGFRLMVKLPPKTAEAPLAMGKSLSDFEQKDHNKVQQIVEGIDRKGEMDALIGRLWDLAQEHLQTTGGEAEGEETPELKKEIPKSKKTLEPKEPEDLRSDDLFGDEEVAV